MSNRLKAMLINKGIHQSIGKNSSIGNLTNVHISYKHDVKKFIVYLSSKHIHNIENLEQTDANPELLQLNIDRGTFIQNVLESIVSNAPQIENKQKKIVIDFSSPNIAKPFHVGHLRSTIIGNFIANINKHVNNAVTKINYLGDWGTQFGLLQYGLKSKPINENNLKNNPIKTLYEAYVSANQQVKKDPTIREEAKNYFANIELGRVNLDDWKKIRELTVQELEKVYQRLGIHFDAYHWESDYNYLAIKDVMTSLESQGIITVDKSGKKVAKVNEKDVAVLKSDNSTLYLARDIAALLDRYKRYNFDKMLYVVDNAQTDHFTAVFDIVRRVNEECASRCQHIKFGRIVGMSTRAGNVVFLNDILDEAKTKMHEKQLQSKNTRSSAMNEETCDVLGTTAVIINDLKQRRQKDYAFSWDRTLQSEGDSGIKLQYLHCRLWSLEKNSGISLPATCDPNYVPEEIVGDVVTELARFEDILQRSLQECEACILVNYLFRLTRHVNRMFNELKVKDTDKETAAQRLLVFHAARLVVKISLEILGVKPLYEM